MATAAMIHSTNRTRPPAAIKSFLLKKTVTIIKPSEGAPFPVVLNTCQCAGRECPGQNLLIFLLLSLRKWIHVAGNSKLSIFSYYTAKC